MHFVCVGRGESVESFADVDVTVLGLVGGAPGGETPRVADSSAAGAGRLRRLAYKTTRMSITESIGSNSVRGRRAPPALAQELRFDIVAGVGTKELLIQRPPHTYIQQNIAQAIQ